MNTFPNNTRIAFVGQPEYFRCIYEHDLDEYYQVREFVLKWGADVNYYKDLIAFNPEVAFFFRPELYPDRLLKSLPGLKVALSSEPIPKYIKGRLVTSNDMEARFDSLKNAKNKYDYFYHYDKTSLRFLQENGFSVAGEFLLPVATGTYRPETGPKTWDWGFFGRDTPHRESFMGIAKRDFNALHVAHGIYGEEFIRLINGCKIGVNLHVDENVSLEHRMHNMMACRIMVISEPLSHNDLLKPGIHYVEVTDPAEFWEALRYYLHHEAEREKIAQNGFNLINEHLSAKKVFPQLIGAIRGPHKLSYTSKIGTGNPAEAVQKPEILTQDHPLILPNLTKITKRLLMSAINLLFYPLFLLLPKNDLVFSEQTWKAGLGEWFLSKIRRLGNKLFPPGRPRGKIYQKLVSQIKSFLGIPAQRALGQIILARYRRLKERELRWGTKRRIYYEHLRNGLKKLLCSRETFSSYKVAEARTTHLRSAKTTIAFVIPSQWLSGGTMVICQHANMLIKNGYEVFLVDNNIDDPYRLDWFPNLLAEVIPLDQANFEVDTAVATHWTTAYTIRHWPARRKLYFIQSDETRFNPPGSEEVALARETYKFPFEFVTIARWLQRWLKDNFGKNAHYVPNGVDPNMFYPDKPLEPKNNKLRVLLEGAIDLPFKGMKEAFAVVEDMDCEVWCVSTSGRPQPGWRCNRFFANVPFSEMRRIYSSCDVLIKMSKVEGFFMPPLEMMACGGTVITNKVTGYDEYIVDGYNALVVEPGDVAAAKEKLQQLIDHRNLLGKLIKNGQATAKKWSWQASKESLEAVLNHKQT